MLLLRLLSSFNHLLIHSIFDGQFPIQRLSLLDNLCENLFEKNKN